MKYIIKFSRIGVLSTLVLLYSCTPKQEVAPIDPSDAVVTISPDADYSSVTEGDVLTYTLTTSQVFPEPVQFGVVNNGIEVGEHDFSVSGGLFDAYASTTQISIILSSDGYPESDETFDFQIDASDDLARNFHVSPDSDIEATSISVENVISSDGLTIGAEWEDPDHHNDFDLLVYLAGDDAAEYDGATGANPESQVLVNSIDDQTIYVDFDPYDVGDDKVEFDLRIGMPDGSFESYTGVWDSSKEYVAGPFGSPAAFEIVKSGSTYTVNFVFAEDTGE